MLKVQRKIQKKVKNIQDDEHFKKSKRFKKLN